MRYHNPLPKWRSKAPVPWEGLCSQSHMPSVEWLATQPASWPHECSKCPGLLRNDATGEFRHIVVTPLLVKPDHMDASCTL